MMLPIGTKVFHSGHGEGEVVGHNGVVPNKYFREKPLEALEIADHAGMLSGLLASCYSADIYPNIIKFNSGYQDVYADTEVLPIN